MKAISLWQPWASLWLTPAKIHETRHWPTTIRGPVVVHAAQRFVKAELWENIVQVLEDTYGAKWGELPTGALIGVIELEDCVSTFDPERRCTNAAHHEDRVCGDWRDGRYAWRRGPEVKVFKTPIPYLGRQGFFTVEDADVAEGLRGDDAAA